MSLLDDIVPLSTVLFGSVHMRMSHEFRVQLTEGLHRAEEHSGNGVPAPAAQNRLGAPRQAAIRFMPGDGFSGISFRLLCRPRICCWSPLWPSAAYGGHSRLLASGLT